MKKQYAWKVVAKYPNNGMFSVAARSKAQVQYRFNRWATAPKWLEDKQHYLLVFAKRESAREFVRRRKQSEERGYDLDTIYKCQVQERKFAPRFMNLYDLAHGHIVVDTNVCLWPYGTLCFKRVKLLSIRG
jgi:hypothetical protein